MEQEKFEEALENFDQALQLDPNHALALNARGYARLRLRYYETALSDFNDAIRLNPSYANAYWNRSAAKKALGDDAGAREDLRRAARLEGIAQAGTAKLGQAQKQ